jgi:uncharacterized membrane protein
MSFIPKDDTWTLLAIIVAGTAAAIALERRYQWGAKLSAPVIALLIAMVLSNTGVVPAEAPAYDLIGDWLVPIALPLLLLKANLLLIARKTGKLLIAFNLASIGTILGAVLAFALFKNNIPEPEKAAGIMTASYIGGMVNFVAVSASTNAGGSMISSLIVADNIIMAGLFLVLFWMAGSAVVRRFFRLQYAESAEEKTHAEAVSLPPPHPPMDVLDLAKSLAVAIGLAAAAMALQRVLTSTLQPGDSDMWKKLAVNKYVLLTAVSLTAATLFSRQLGRLNSAEPVGTFLLYLFLFCVGLPANVRTMFLPGEEGMVMYYLFAFCFVMAAANLVFVVVTGKLFRLSLEDIVLASNASVGGPPTAAAMAISKGWSRLVLPALLAGLYGYAVGTPLGIMVTTLLSNK